jgi:hypothetical protein
MDQYFERLKVSVQIPAEYLMPMLHLLNKEIERIKTESPEAFDNPSPGGWAESIKETASIIAAAHYKNLRDFT